MRYLLIFYLLYMVSLRPCQAIEYQFTWPDNRLRFSSVQEQPTNEPTPSSTPQPSLSASPAPVTPSLTPTATPAYFSYAFQLNQNYPLIDSDLPLQVFAIDQQPLFWSSVRALASLPLEVEWNLAREFLPFLGEYPGYDLWRYFSLFPEVWTSYQPTIWLNSIANSLANTDSFSDVLAIREADGSLTLSFRLLQELPAPVRLWLVCQDETGQILQEKILRQKDSFLWSGATFQLFLGEAILGSELLFSLPENTCVTELSLRSQQQNGVFSAMSQAVTIIPVEELR